MELSRLRKERIRVLGNFYLAENRILWGLGDSLRHFWTTLLDKRLAEYLGGTTKNTEFLVSRCADQMKKAHAGPYVSASELW